VVEKKYEMESMLYKCFVFSQETLHSLTKPLCSFSGERKHFARDAKFHWEMQTFAREHKSMLDT